MNLFATNAQPVVSFGDHSVKCRYWQLSTKCVVAFIGAQRSLLAHRL